MKTKDLELLSSYLDRALGPAEMRRLEQRLQADPELRAALEALRATRDVLRQLPRRRAPRSFVLSPRQVAHRPPLPRFYPLLQWSTALTVFLVAILLTLPLILPRPSFTASMVAPAETATVLEAAPLRAAPSPQATAPSLAPPGGGVESPPATASPPMIAALPQETPMPQAGMPKEGATPESPARLAGEHERETENEAPPSELSPLEGMLPLARSLGIGLALLAAIQVFLLLLIRWWSAYQWRKKL
jgi:hypothetical protein